MKSKTALGCLAAVLLLAASPTAGFGQRAGFQAGIAPPPGPFQPVHPRPPVNGTFHGSGLPFIPGPTVLPPIPPTPVFPPIPAPISVLPPGQTILPNVPVNTFPSPAFPGNGFFPSPFVVQPLTPPIVQPLAPPIVQPLMPPVVQPVAPFRPFPGMPRGDVFRQFGQPSVTVITSSGETLFFPGGVTVIIQNGVVAGTR